MTGKEKLEKEMQANIDKAPDRAKEQIEAQMRLVFNVLFDKCENDKEFESQVLLKHKSFERCMNHMNSEARKMCVSGAQYVAVSDEVVFNWIYEYYALDDKATVEREIKKKKAEAEKKEQKEKEKEVNEDIDNQSKEDLEDVTHENVKEVNTVTSKKPKSDNQLEGQMDIFSMMM